MSRRDHTAHDLSCLRIDLFGETAQSSSTKVFGRKARGTVDKRGNVLATAPFKRRKHKAIDKENFTPGEPEKSTVSNVNDEEFESGHPKKKRQTYYPGILPYLDVLEGAGTSISHLENGQPTADLLKRIHRFACEYYSDRGVLYDASQEPRYHNYRPTSKQRNGKLDVPMIEFAPIPTAGTLHSEEETGGPSRAGTELAPEQTPDRSLHRNMFRAFDGTALVTIGMLLQEHITSFLQRPPTDPDEWNDILMKEGEKEKRQNEWKAERSKARRSKPQVSSRPPTDDLTSGSGDDNDERSSDDGDDGDDGSTKEGDP